MPNNKFYKQIWKKCQNYNFKKFQHILPKIKCKYNNIKDNYFFHEIYQLRDIKLIHIKSVTIDIQIEYSMIAAKWYVGSWLSEYDFEFDLDLEWGSIFFDAVKTASLIFFR